MKGGKSKKMHRSEIVSGDDAFAMFETMCLDKPGAWFSSMSSDRQSAIHLNWYAGWWLCISETGSGGIVASFGTNLSQCKAVGRAKTISDAKEALADLIATSDEEEEAITAAGSLEEARELMRAVIEINKRELLGI